MAGPDDSHQGLLERARNGDEQALGRLLEMYRNYLRLQASHGATPIITGTPSPVQTNCRQK